MTPYVLDDFELRCSFRLAAGGNSGLFLRTAPNAANPATDTYELNICDIHATHKSGSLVARHVAEVLGRGVAARAVGLGLPAGLCLLCGYLRAPYFTLPFNLATWAVLAATAGTRRG